MLRFAFIVLTFVACGCATHRLDLTLAHSIQIPKEWRAGSEDAAFPAFGVAERYVSPTFATGEKKPDFSKSFV